MSTAAEDLSSATQAAPTRGEASPVVTGRSIGGASTMRRPRTPNPPPPRQRSPAKSRPQVNDQTAPASANASSTTAAAAAAPVSANLTPLPSPVVVVHRAERSMNKNVHVADRKHRGSSRNDLGGFFTA